METTLDNLRGEIRCTSLLRLKMLYEYKTTQREAKRTQLP